MAQNRISADRDDRNRTIKLLVIYIIGSFLLCILILVFSANFIDNPTFYQLTAVSSQSDAFLQMNLEAGELAYMLEEYESGVQGLDAYDVITLTMLSQQYTFEPVMNRKKNGIDDMYYYILLAKIQRYKPVEYQKLKNAYIAVYDCLECFPVPRNILDGEDVTFSKESWHSVRTYGGNHLHEGIDIMGGAYERGYYPVISCSAGTVTEAGWSEAGGYYVKVQSEGGCLFYYAHLYEFGAGIEAGTQVSAGALLGFMGDSGYGAAEGTTGNFEVHLHFGIYQQVMIEGEETWQAINPYAALRYLYEYHRTYAVY